MNIVVFINCTKCEKQIKVPVKQDEKGKQYLSDSIEQQGGFYCSLDQQYSMKINCNCGNEVRLYY